MFGLVYALILFGNYHSAPLPYPDKAICERVAADVSHNIQRFYPGTPLLMCEPTYVQTGPKSG